jgi:hypothetical protein
MKRFPSILVAAVLFLGGVLTAYAAPTIKLELALKQAQYTGRCPVTLKGKLHITADAACTVEYGTMRSDGVKVGPMSAVFAGAGSKDVSVEFPFSGDFHGWVQAGARTSKPLELIKPAGILSNRVTVDVNCRAISISAAELPCQTEVSGGCCSAQACNLIRITGGGFGAARGTSRLLIDGSPAVSYQSWSDTTIVAAVALRLGDHTTSIAVDDGSMVVSNTLNMRFLITWYMYGPRGCRAGEEVTVQAWGGGSSQNGRTLVMTNVGAPEYPMEILSWTGTGETGSDRASIRFRVPASIPIPYSAYILEIKNGPDVISKMLSFGVLHAEPFAR